MAVQNQRNEVDENEQLANMAKELALELRRTKLAPIPEGPGDHGKSINRGDREDPLNMDDWINHPRMLLYEFPEPTHDPRGPAEMDDDEKDLLRALHQEPKWIAAFADYMASTNDEHTHGAYRNLAWNLGWVLGHILPGGPGQQKAVVEELRQQRSGGPGGQKAFDAQALRKK